MVYCGLATAIPDAGFFYPPKKAMALVSYQAVKAVLKNSTQKGTVKLVLVCIAEHYNEKTKTAWPGIETLADYCNVSKQSIHNALNKLVEDKELRIDYKAGARGVNVYQILCLDEGEQSSGLDSQAGFTEPSSQLERTVKPALPEPLRTIKNHITPPTGELTTELLNLCKLDFDFVKHNNKKKQQLSNTIKLLTKQEATLQELQEFEHWRKVHHWTSGSTATLVQVGEFWGQYKQWITDGRPDKPEGDNRRNGRAKKPGKKQTMDQKRGFDPYTNEYVYPDGRREPATLSGGPLKPR